MKILLALDSYIERHKVGGYLADWGLTIWRSEAARKRSRFWRALSLLTWLCWTGCCLV